MDEKEIYKKAVELWGETFQRVMLIEECAELISSICKHWRGRVGDDDVMGEAVDVQLMINELRHILNDDTEWNKKMRFKLDRLEERFKEKEEENAN